MRRRWRGVAAILLAPAPLIGLAPTAGADDWDSLFPTRNTNWLCPDGVCLADSSVQTYFVHGNVPNYVEAAIGRTLTNSYVYTDVEFTRSSWQPDLYIDMDDSLSERGLVGLYDCSHAVNSSRCDTATVYFDNGWAYSHRSSPGLQAAACHEIGHSVGLLHGEHASNEYGQKASNYASWLHCMEKTLSDHTPTGLGSFNASQLRQMY